MTRVIQTACIITLCLAFAPTNTLSQYFPPEFAITVQDQKFLTYAQIDNLEDTAYTTYRVGEFLVKGTTITKQLVFLNSASPQTCYAGSDSVGPDNTLAGHLKTNVFSYGQGDSLRFHRMLSVSMDCTGFSDTPPDIDPNSNSQINTDPLHAHFLLRFTGHLKDESRFVIQLVDANTDNTLYTIDSVGVSQTAGQQLAIPYGTSPLTMNRAVALPNSHAGANVYIRILPYRYGTTPYGMKLSFYASTYSLSSFCEYTMSGSNSINQPGVKSTLDSLYLARLVAHYDSVVVDSGCVLSLDGGLRLANDSLLTWFLNRYFDSVVVSSSDLSFRPRCYPSFAKNTSANNSRRGTSISRSSDAPQLNVLVSALPDGHDVKVSVSGSNCSGNTLVQVVHLTSGELVFTTTVTGSPNFSRDFEIRNLVNGPYVARISNQGMGAQMKFAINN